MCGIYNYRLFNPTPAIAGPNPRQGLGEMLKSLLDTDNTINFDNKYRMKVMSPPGFKLLRARKTADYLMLSHLGSIAYRLRIRL